MPPHSVTYTSQVSKAQTHQLLSRDHWGEKHTPDSGRLNELVCDQWLEVLGMLVCVSIWILEVTNTHTLHLCTHTDLHHQQQHTRTH